MTSVLSSKPRLAILDDYQHVALTSADWSQLQSRADITVFDDTIQSKIDPSDLVSRLEPFDIVCTMRERTAVTRAVFERLPNLKLLTTTGMRNASIDMKAADAAEIIVCGSGYAGNGTVEHNWALIMALTRNIAQEHVNTVNAKPQWQSSLPTSLSGKTLGLVGVGNIGKGTAKIAHAFGMKTQAWSPNLTPERAEAAGVKYVSKEELFSTSDIISIHMVLAASTINLITKDDLGRMKPTAFLVNTSRGPIINEADLLHALSSDRIKGAGLDVYDVEPLPLTHPLRTSKNVILTPHMGYVSDDLYRVFWGDTVENVQAFLDGKPIRIINNVEYESSRAGRKANL